MRYINKKEIWYNGKGFEVTDKKSYYEDIIRMGYENGSFFAYTIDLLTGKITGNATNKTYLKKLWNKWAL